MRSARMTLPGHPDKVCDLVAEAIVDEYLRRDIDARLRLSVNGGRGALFISGDVKSTADFDVAAVVKRTLGTLGVMADMEPFVALEPVSSDAVSQMSMGRDVPVTVHGYATAETDERIPETVSIARRIAKKLDDLRQHDEAWFWLGPDAEVVVHAPASKVTEVSLRVEHGRQAMGDVRDAITRIVQEISPALEVRVNELGPIDARGLEHVMGASGRDGAPYGGSVPSMSAMSGLDIHTPEKGGAWIARAAARSLVQRGSRAVMVQLTYAPGDLVPRAVSARDERGADLSGLLEPKSLSLDRVREWWHPGLNTDAGRWGFAGESGLPWEGEV